MKGVCSLGEPLIVKMLQLRGCYMLRSKGRFRFPACNRIFSWSMVHGLWSMVYGLWSTGDGRWGGLWSKPGISGRVPSRPRTTPSLHQHHRQAPAGRCVRVCACMCVRACVNMRACVHERVVQYHSTCNDGQKAWSAPTRCEYGADLPPSIPTSMFHAPSLV